jgi:hypothetical protein
VLYIVGPRTLAAVSLPIAGKRQQQPGEQRAESIREEASQLAAPGK